MSSMWTCYFCYISMPVADGPYHLVEDDHIERLVTRLSNITICLVNKRISNSLTSYCTTEEEFASAHPKTPAPVSKPDSPTLAQSDSPIDRFFESFPSFKYNSSLPPSTSYEHLERQQKLPPGSQKSKARWETYQSALRQEFDLWYGSEDDLTAWHSLCRAIGINPLPMTCEGCEKVVRNRHVNMIDLIHWSRRGKEANSKQVQIFRTVRELSAYSRQNGKIFKNTLHDNSEQGGVVLRHLLRRLFSPVVDEDPSI